jgi:microcystin-dependent protein
MPSHNHGVNDPGHSHQINPGDSGGQGRCDDASGGDRNATWTEKANTGISIQNTGGGQAHNNLQPYITVNYIIKY